jgi:hypothetical protein
MQEKSKQESSDEEQDDRESREEGDTKSPVLEENAGQEEESRSKLRPSGIKIGEGRDNLRQREAWFRKRTGAGK